MIRTEYTRQVPIKHAVGKSWKTENNWISIELVITGYKQQRAWWFGDEFDQRLFENQYKEQYMAILRGEDVEGFKWEDLPVGEQC